MTVDDPGHDGHAGRIDGLAVAGLVGQRLDLGGRSDLDDSIAVDQEGTALLRRVTRAIQNDGRGVPARRVLCEVVPLCWTDWRRG